MEFRSVRGHIEVYVDGVFLLSADNLREAEEDLKVYLANMEGDYD